MSIRMPVGNRPPRLLVVAAGIVVLLLVAGLAGTRLYTDLLFYREVGFAKVFTTIATTRLLLFALALVIMATVIGANLTIAYLGRPGIRPMSLEQQNLERYRMAVEPHLRRLLIAISLGFGVLAGLSMQEHWQVWQLWLHGQSFGVADPQFGKDISFYAFTYPFLRMVVSFLFACFVISTIVAAATHYLFGGIRLQTQGERVVAGARAHLSLLLGIVVLLKAVSYYLDRFGLAFSERGIVTGASYTDINAVLPAKTILAVVSVLCAALFFANIVRRNWALPAISLGLLVLSAVVIGGVYPALVQQFQVKPNEITKESAFIQRNIDATRKAYQLDTAVVTGYDAKTTATAGEIRNDKGTVPNARLLDPNVLKPTFEQQQQIRNFFGFPESLDIDRYTIKGKTQDYVVAVRELDQDGLSADQRNWINTHLIYTHGMGFVAAPANTVDSSGRPDYLVKNIPPTGPIAFTTQPRIYYGELSPQYSVVGTKQLEIDGPSNANDTGQVNNTYDGTGGVSIGSPLRKLLFALRFREKNLLLSSALTSESRIMYNRSPRERVEKVAPYLTIDGDPYPAVVDGRVTWILDGYTTSDGYPYAQRTQLGDITTDALTGANRAALAKAQVNYIRNSVKATVDAYDGTVTLYAFDESDPVLRTWTKVFPGTVKPRAELDAKTELVAHLRYPEDLFKVQRDLLSQYHVTDSRAFYSKEDFWAVPADPNSGARVANQAPYYLLLQVPGQKEPGFSLTSALVARRRPNLAAFVSVSSEMSDYGKLRVLRLPSDTTVDGPAQVNNKVESSPLVSQQLTLLRGGGSEVIQGNLLTLPVGGGLLYVQPFYVQARGASAFPTLQRVAVVFGEKVGFAPTLKEALDSVFGAGSAPATPTPPSKGSTGSAGSELRAALADAQAAYDDGVKALAKGDFAAYGKAQERLKEALDRAAAASASSGSSPAPSGSATPAPSPSETQAPAA